MDRRHLLRLGGAFGALGVGAPFALQLAAAGSAAGQTAGDYKALVCVFLFGGNDGHNTVLATDADSYVSIVKTLAADRAALAEMHGEIRAMMKASPICDCRRFARDTVRLYRQMWRTWCAGRQT